MDKIIKSTGTSMITVILGSYITKFYSNNMVEFGPIWYFRLNVLEEMKKSGFSSCHPRLFGVCNRRNYSQ